MGFISTPLSIQLLDNPFSWEDNFITNQYTLESDSFSNVYCAEGLKGNGTLQLDPNGQSGIYAFIKYTFKANSKIEKAVIDITAESISQTNAVKVLVNDNLVSMFNGMKTIDITSNVGGQVQFTVELEFWVINSSSPQDLTIKIMRITGNTETSQDQSGIIQPTESPQITEVSGEETYYTKLSEYIRDTNNSYLGRSVARIGLGWFYIIKTLLGVEI